MSDVAEKDRVQDAESEVQVPKRAEDDLVEVKSTRLRKDLMVEPNAVTTGDMSKLTENVITEGFENQPKCVLPHRYIGSTISTPVEMDKYGLTDEDKRRASTAFRFNMRKQASSPIHKLCQQHPRSPRDLQTWDGLMQAYKQELDLKEELSHAISRLQLELDEKDEMFQQTVSFGEKVDDKARKFKDDLQEQLDINCLLRRENRILKEKNCILATTISEMKVTERDTQQALTEANRTKRLFEAEMLIQQKMSSRIKEDFVSAQLCADELDNDVKKQLDQLNQELNREKTIQESMNESYKMLEEKIKNTSENLKKANTKIETLEKALAENNLILMKISSEKAHLAEDCDNLWGTLQEVEQDLFTARQKLEAAGLTECVRDRAYTTITTVDESDLAAQLSAIGKHTQISECERESDPEMEIIYQSKTFSKEQHNMPLNSQRIVEASPELPSVIREYLHITATAVKYHFPDLHGVSSEMLIEKVRNDPFYLYYDHMMRHMRDFKKQLIIDEQERQAAIEKGKANYPPQESSGIISRFMALVHRTSRTISLPPITKLSLEPDPSSAFMALATPTEETRYVLSKAVEEEKAL